MSATTPIYERLIGSKPVPSPPACADWRTDDSRSCRRLAKRRPALTQVFQPLFERHFEIEQLFGETI